MKDCLLKLSKKVLFSIVAVSVLMVVLPEPAYGNRFSSLSLQAQGQTVKGRIVDESGEAVIGASVLEKDTFNGVATDLDGNFSIKVSSSSATLVISYVGFVDTEVSATDPRLAELVLLQDTERIEDVVVVGYGVQRKATLTGSVTAVGSEVLESKGALSTPLQALQGSVPGVTITRTSSAPGEEGWNMSLRGSSSVNSTAPLIIIDGVEAPGGTSDLRNINPDDIESMNFLKDASAAIYGSKAAGGVVLITTKKAKAGKAVVTYNGSFTAKFVGNQADYMNLDEWADGVTAAQIKAGVTDQTWIQYAAIAKQYKGSYIDRANSPSPFDDSQYVGVLDFVFFDTEWNDILWGTATSTSHDVSVSGGSDKATYRVSAGYMHDGSTLQWGNNYKDRFNMRVNNTLQLSDAIKLTSSISTVKEMQVTPTQIGKVLTSSNPQPGLPASTIDGKPYAWGGWTTPNWLAELGGDNVLDVMAFNISEQLNFQLTDDLSAVVQGGYNSSLAKRDKVTEAITFYNYAGTEEVRTDWTQENSNYIKSYGTTNYYSVSGYLNYNKTVAQDHTFGAMAGVEYNYNASERTQTTAENIKSSLEVPTGSGTISVAPSKSHSAMMSYFGRVNYDYKSRYLLDVNLRYDGSSKFTAANRWSLFGGVSAGWRISEEPFFEPIRHVVSDLKLRASYGELGNQSGIGLYDGTQLYNFSSQGGVYMNGANVSIINTNGTIASTERTWERIHTTNVGLDFGFFDNRLVGSVDAFLKKNNNMLISASYSGVLGDKAPSANIGQFQAQGLEVAAGWTDRIGEVTYNIGGNISYSTNEVTNIGATSVLSSGYRKTTQGYPLGSYFGLVYAGKIETEDDLAKYNRYYLQNNGIDMPSNLSLGDNMFQDMNGDGKLTEEDYQYLGSDSPEVSYSFKLGLSWKGFDLNAMFQGVADRTIFREIAGSIPMRQRYMNSMSYSVGNVWSAETPNGFYPSYTSDGNVNTYNYQCSSWSVQNGAYLRLKDVTLGYTLPEKVVSGIKGISSIRAYVSGSDLWELDYIRDGWDPEASKDVKDLDRYPFTRNVTVGLSLTF